MHNNHLHQVYQPLNRWFALSTQVWMWRGPRWSKGSPCAGDFMSIHLPYSNGKKAKVLNLATLQQPSRLSNSAGNYVYCLSINCENVLLSLQVLYESKLVYGDSIWTYSASVQAGEGGNQAGGVIRLGGRVKISLWGNKRLVLLSYIFKSENSYSCYSKAYAVPYCNINPCYHVTIKDLGLVLGTKLSKGNFTTSTVQDPIPWHRLWSVFISRNKELGLPLSNFREFPCWIRMSSSWMIS